MKRIIKTYIVAAVAVVGLLGTYSCVEPDDLITDGAKEGGLVAPVSSNLSFVGNPISVTVETTEGITEVSFYKKYTKDGVASTEVFDRTIAVSGGEVSFTADYAALKSGITGMPTLPNELEVGDFWTFRIVSKLTDGREVQSGISVKVTVDNPYSGTYAANGTRWNFNSAADANTSTMPPTGWTSAPTWTFDTDLTTVDAVTCKIHCGNDNGGFGYMNIKINGDNTVDIISTADTGLANLVPLAGWPSTYNPSTKTFVLYYQYTNDTGTHRVLTETLVRK